MKLKVLALSVSMLIIGCSSVQPVKPMMNYLQYQGTCRLTNDDFYTLRKHIYPADALAVGQEGWVVLKFDLLDGVPKNIKVIGSSPKGIFESSAVDSLSNSLYKPTVNKEGCLTVRNFKLE